MLLLAFLHLVIERSSLIIVMISDPNNNKVMRSTGIEPVSTPWQGAILPLNYERVAFNGNRTRARSLEGSDSTTKL